MAAQLGRDGVAVIAGVQVAADVALAATPIPPSPAHSPLASSLVRKGTSLMAWRPASVRVQVVCQAQ